MRPTHARPIEPLRALIEAGQFYDTEVDSKKLQLSASQINGAEEARVDQPEGRCNLNDP